MKYPPKFSVVSDLNNEEFELEIETMNAKLRYSARREAEDKGDQEHLSGLDAPEPRTKKSGENQDAPGPRRNPGDPSFSDPILPCQHDYI